MSEQVQRRATKIISLTNRHLQWEHRLGAVELPTLENRRIRPYMILMFKIIKYLVIFLVDLEFSNNDNIGHIFKLKKK